MVKYMIISKNFPNLEDSKLENKKIENNVNVQLPLNIGDEFLIRNTKYNIVKITMTNDCIFVVNPNIWVNIEQLQFVKMEGNHKLFKVVDNE